MKTLVQFAAALAAVLTLNVETSYAQNPGSEFVERQCFEAWGRGHRH